MLPSQDANLQAELQVCCPANSATTSDCDELGTDYVHSSSLCHLIHDLCSFN